MTWATATALNSLVLSGSAPSAKTAWLKFSNASCTRGELLASSGQLGGGRVVERLSHRCSVSVAPCRGQAVHAGFPSSRSAAASGRCHRLPSTVQVRHRSVVKPSHVALMASCARCLMCGGRRLRPGPRHRAAGLDQLLVRSEQCFMNSGEIHPCRTVCPYQQDNDPSSPRQLVLTGCCMWTPASADVFVELVAEVLEGGEDGAGRPVPEGAEDSSECHVANILQ